MRCAECEFYNPLDANKGECRESPPRNFPVPVKTFDGMGIAFQSVFPQVPSDAWCGAFSDVDEVREVPRGSPTLVNS